MMKMSMLKIVIGVVIAGIAAEYFLGNRWIGFFGAGIPLSGLYIYQEYKAQEAEAEKKRSKHKNKYR